MLPAHRLEGGSQGRSEIVEPQLATRTNRKPTTASPLLNADHRLRGLQMDLAGYGRYSGELHLMRVDRPLSQLQARVGEIAPLPAPDRPAPPRMTVRFEDVRLTGADNRVAGGIEPARRNEQRVIVPAIVLAELITGKPADAALWRVLRRLPEAGITGTISARAGVLRQRAESIRRKKRDLTVDAVVAAVATSVQPSVVITADLDDLRLLTDGSDVRILPIAG